MREPYRDAEELGEVREHGAVESVRRGPEEEGVVAEQDGERLQVPEGVGEETLLFGSNLQHFPNTFVQGSAKAQFKGCVSLPPPQRPGGGIMQLSNQTFAQPNNNIN